MTTTASLVGKRVRLVRCTDVHTAIPLGTEGWVTFVDSLGTVHVRWDNGSRLGLIHGAGDRWEVMPS